MPATLTPDVIILLLRGGIVLVLYLFLLAIVRLINQELRAESGARSSEVARGTLVVVDPGTSRRPVGQTLSLSTVTRLGRSNENTVILDDEFVSASHALVTLHDGRWWVRDAGSTNGTVVNGSTVSGELPVRSGDVLQVGGVRLEFNL